MGRSHGKSKKSKALSQTRKIVLGNDYSLNPNQSLFQSPELLISLIGSDQFLDTLVSLAPESITAAGLKKDLVFLEFTKQEIDKIKKETSLSLFEKINEDFLVKGMRDDLILKIKSGNSENVSAERTIYDLRSSSKEIAFSFFKEKASKLNNRTREYISGDFSKNIDLSPIKEDLYRLAIGQLFDDEVLIDVTKTRENLERDLDRKISKDNFSEKNIKEKVSIKSASAWTEKRKVPSRDALENQAEEALSSFVAEEVAGFLTDNETGKGSLRMISDSILKGETFDDLIYKLKPLFSKDTNEFEKIISKDWAFLEPEYFEYILKRAGREYITSGSMQESLKRSLLDV